MRPDSGPGRFGRATPLGTVGPSRAAPACCANVSCAESPDESAQLASFPRYRCSRIWYSTVALRNFVTAFIVCSILPPAASATRSIGMSHCGPTSMLEKRRSGATAKCAQFCPACRNALACDLGSIIAISVSAGASRIICAHSVIRSAKSD